MTPQERETHKRKWRMASLYVCETHTDLRSMAKTWCKKKCEQHEWDLKQFNFDRVIITTTVMAYNIAHLDKLHQWFEENKQDNWEIYFTNVVATPAYLNPQVLPNSVLDKIDFRFPNINYNSKDDSNLLDLFVKYTKDLDKIRNESWKASLPDIAQMIEECNEKKL